MVGQSQDGMNRDQPRHAMRQRAFLIVTCAIWLIVGVAVSLIVAKDPRERSVVPVYHEAAADWVARQPLYSNEKDLNYLPQFALLFSPFHALPVPAGDIAWRWLNISVFVIGIWQLVRRLPPHKSGEYFFWVTLFSIAASLGSIRNGQATPLLTGLFFIGADLLMQQRWWMASVMLVLSLAVKPLGIVLLMLGPLVYRPTLWRIALLVPLLLLTPFLAAPSEYVSQQMSSFWDDLGHCASVTENRFADLNGIARNIAGSERGWEIPAQPLRVIGAVAAALTALCWWLGGRRVDEPLRGYYLLTLGIGYLLLFNPMTESNGYIMLAPLAATCALYCMDVSKRQTAGWLMLMIALSVGIGGGVMRKVDPEFALWFKPLMAAAFIVLMSVVLFKREREGFSVSDGRAFPA